MSGVRMDVKIEGLDKLQKKLVKMQKMSEVKKTVAEFATGAVSDLQRQTYVSFIKGYSTGWTREHADKSIEDSGFTAVIGVRDTNYAKYVEFGTRYMEAEPFMQPMIDRQSREFKRRLERLVQ